MLSLRSKLILGLLIVITFAPFSRLSAAEKPGEIVVMLDQSGSMEGYDSKLVAQVWLNSFVGTFDGTYRIVLVGFDERIQVHSTFIVDGGFDKSELLSRIESIPTKGLVTDLEEPFRYMLERGGYERLKMAIMLTDGKPQIWDINIPYLSKRVQRDPNYKDLNERYNDLKKQGLSEQQLFAELGDAYHQRNLKLIEQRLAKFEELLGQKMVIWDISGRSKQLEAWAKKAAAQYVPIPDDSTKVPIDLLRASLIDLQNKTSVLVDEDLPPRYKAEVEAALETVPDVPGGPNREAKDTVRTAESRPVTEGEARLLEKERALELKKSELESEVRALEKEKRALQREVQALEGRKRALGSDGPAMDGEERALEERKRALAERGRALEIGKRSLDEEERALQRQERGLQREEQALQREERTQKSDSPEPTGDVRTPDRAAGTSETKSPERGAPAPDGKGPVSDGKGPVSDGKGPVPDGKESAQGISVSALLALLALLALAGGALWFYRQRGQQGAQPGGASSGAPEGPGGGLTAAEEAHEAALEQLKGPAHGATGATAGQDKRFWLRIPTPPGVMFVHWIDRDGGPHISEALNISVHGILFSASGFGDGTIEKIDCPGFAFDAKVIKATIRRIENGQVAAIIDEFSDDTNNKMRWVEIVTRISEGG